MIFLLDTDTCVFWLRGNSTVQQRVAAVGPEAIAISTIVLAELRYGAECSDRLEANHRAIDDFVSGIAVVGVDPETARRFGEIKAYLRRQGNLIEDFDLLLAATALAHGMTFVTNNTSHFNRIPQLAPENWTQA